jgi:hypothetical protein
LAASLSANTGEFYVENGGLGDTLDVSTLSSFFLIFFAAFFVFLVAFRISFFFLDIVPPSYIHESVDLWAC